MCIENLKCVALTVPEITATGVLVGVVNLDIGEEVADGTIQKSEDVGLIVRAISFQNFQPMWL